MHILFFSGDELHSFAIYRQYHLLGVLALYCLPNSDSPLDLEKNLFWLRITGNKLWYVCALNPCWRRAERTSVERSIIVIANAACLKNPQKIAAVPAGLSPERQSRNKLLTEVQEIKVSIRTVPAVTRLMDSLCRPGPWVGRCIVVVSQQHPKKKVPRWLASWIKRVFC